MPHDKGKKMMDYTPAERKQMEREMRAAKMTKKQKSKKESAR